MVCVLFYLAVQNIYISDQYLSSASLQLYSAWQPILQSFSCLISIVGSFPLILVLFQAIHSTR